MALFICKIGTSDGRVVYRFCHARNRFELQESLAEEGCCVFQMRRVFLPVALFRPLRQNRWPQKRFLLFNQEMLVLFRSGMPILEVLQSLEQEKDPPVVKEVLQNVRSAVEGGSSLSHAFSLFPEFFPSLFVATVASGEKTGDLAQTLFRYLEYQKRMLRLRDRLKSAAMYPLVLACATMLVLLFMIFFVVPSFVRIYADAQVALPLLTRIVLYSAELLSRGWFLILLMAGVLFLAVGHFIRTPKGRVIFDETLLRLPWLGDFFRLSALVNFCRTTGTILGSGLPLVEALELARGVLNNVVIQKGLAAVIGSLNEGENLGDALAWHAVFPPVANRLLATGERGGNLQQMFDEVADYYESEIDNRLERIASLLEPLVLVFVGLVIGGIVIAIYLPVFQLAGTVG